MAESEDMLEQLESQLVTLYAEKEILSNELGVSNAEEVLELVHSLESQLVDLYSERENAIIVDGEKLIITGPKKIIIKKQ